MSFNELIIVDELEIPAVTSKTIRNIAIMLPFLTRRKIHLELQLLKPSFESHLHTGKFFGAVQD